MGFGGGWEQQVVAEIQPVGGMWDIGRKRCDGADAVDTVGIGGQLDIDH